MGNCRCHAHFQVETEHTAALGDADNSKWAVYTTARVHTVNTYESDFVDCTLSDCELCFEGERGLVLVDTFTPVTLQDLLIAASQTTCASSKTHLDSHVSCDTSSQTERHLNAVHEHFVRCDSFIYI